MSQRRRVFNRILSMYRDGYYKGPWLDWLLNRIKVKDATKIIGDPRITRNPGY